MESAPRRHVHRHVQPGKSMPEPDRSPYDFKEMLFVTNPFSEIELTGIDGEGIEEDRQGWGSNNGAFRQVIAAFRPATIIELGTWKGASAIHMAQICRELGIAAQILCVDTFIGFPSFYFRREQAHVEFKIKGGFPRLYWTFMKNVVAAGVEDIITPLVQLTEHGAQICRAKNIRADLIYVDGDHSYEGCRRDLANYSPILAEGGMFLCDDYQWEGARRAIDEYIAQTGCQYAVAGNKVLLSPRRDITALKLVFDDLARKHALFADRKRARAGDA